MMSRRASINVVVSVAAAWLCADGHVAVAQSGSANEHWVASWSAALVLRPQTGSPPGQVPPQPAQQGPPVPQTPAPPPITLNNQTLRQIVHLSAGGTRTRVVLANTFGTAPLTIGAAHIALHGKGARIVPGSGSALTFSGRPSVTIPAGAVMLSDAASIAVPALSDLVIDLFLPGDLTASTSPLTIHSVANQTNYISSPGNFAGAPEVPVSAMLPSWIFLASVEVTAAQQVSAIVAFGDSITDGTRSTNDANARWPDQLAKRLAANNGSVRAVLNTGIAANRLLGEINAAVFPFGFNAGVNALARFDRDVIAQTGVTHVLVLEGINDIGLAGRNPLPSAEDLIAAHEQIVERAHAHGMKIFGATLLPFEGAAYWTAEGEAKRQAFNTWLKKGDRYDGVIDFDAAVHDPANPTKILPRYDSGDHLHPNDAGYHAMGDAIDPKLFETPQRTGKSKNQRTAR
jgi:lysophospholipase L1-like esterase